MSLLARAGGFVAGHFEDGVDGLLLGGVDEAAGVDDEDFGVFGAGGEARAGAVEQAHHDLGVDEVFGAAQGNKAHGRGRGWGGFGHMSIVPGCGFDVRDGHGYEIAPVPAGISASARIHPARRSNASYSAACFVRVTVLPACPLLRFVPCSAFCEARSSQPGRGVYCGSLSDSAAATLRRHVLSGLR